MNRKVTERKRIIGYFDQFAPGKYRYSMFIRNAADKDLFLSDAIMHGSHGDIAVVENVQRDIHEGPGMVRIENEDRLLSEEETKEFFAEVLPAN